MMLIELNEYQLVKLLSCKNTKKRGFSEWSLQSLINEAITEFNLKYGEGKKE